MIVNMNGGGGSGGTLTVMAPAGVTVTVSKGNKSKTRVANSDGVAVFKGLSSGEWTVSIKDGDKTAQTKLTINVDFEVTIAFFAATINVTYPEGSICTATDGVTTLTAPDTSGAWECVVPNAGTWTVSITDGNKSVSNPVKITAEGQSKSVSLAYKYYLFKSGKGAVVELIEDAEINGSITVDTNNITVDYSAYNSFYVTALRTYEKIDLTNYSTLKMTCIPSAVLNGSINSLGVTSTAFEASAEESVFSSRVEIDQSDSETTVSLDVSRITSSMYCGFLYGGTMTVTNIWLE